MLTRRAFYIVTDICIVYYTDVIVFVRSWKPIALLHEPNSLFSDGIESQADRENC